MFILFSHADSAQICRRVTRLAALLGALFVSMDGYALYKVIGPDGKITYTDLPPGGSADKVVPVPNVTNLGTATSSVQLPIQLRQPVNRYPVVLYTAVDCPGCDKGRSMLKQRGIPFTEYQIINAKDSEALQKKTGGRETPVMMIGTQVSRGFDPNLWGQYLDAAGYPPKSILPQNYDYNLPKPLTNEAPSQSSAPKPTQTTQPGPPTQRNNAPPAPTGIQF